MPCNSDHMEQTRKEAAIQHAAQIFGVVYNLLGMHVPQWLDDADCYYADDDTVIPKLCEFMNGLPDDALDTLLYSDAKDKKRRAVADWWEKHEQVDRDREATTGRADRHEALRLSARAKLTPDERRAVGLDE